MGQREIDPAQLADADKFEAILTDIRECVERSQPVLVGTASIETSELLAALLQTVDSARRHVVIASVKVFDTMSAVEAATVRDAASRSDTAAICWIWRSCSPRPRRSSSRSGSSPST